MTCSTSAKSVDTACTQAALAEAEEAAGPAPERDFDEASEAGSAVSGMSAYTTASTTAGSTVTSSGRSVSTIGGRKAQHKARQKVLARGNLQTHVLLRRVILVLRVIIRCDFAVPLIAPTFMYDAIAIVPRLQASKGTRIRQGSPQEEAALALHVSALAPSPEALRDAGQLAELLVLLGHARDASLLQAALSALAAAQAVRPALSSTANNRCLPACLPDSCITLNDGAMFLRRHLFIDILFWQGAAEYIGAHPAPVDPASERLLEASKPGAAPGSAADWKWDLLRPVQLLGLGVDLATG